MAFVEREKNDFMHRNMILKFGNDYEEKVKLTHLSHALVL